MSQPRACIPPSPSQQRIMDSLGASSSVFLPLHWGQGLSAMDKYQHTSSLEPRKLQTNPSAEHSPPLGLTKCRVRIGNVTAQQAFFGQLSFQGELGDQVTE